MKWAIGIVALFGLVAVFGDISEQSDSQESGPQVESSGRSTMAASTTTPQTQAPTEDLPKLEAGSDDLFGILAAENLLQSLGLPVQLNAQWEIGAQENLDNLRALVGLQAGGLTDDLWLELFDLEPSSALVEDKGKNSGVKGLLVPKQAVAISPGVRGKQTIGGGTYVLPYGADVDEVVSWFGERFSFQDFDEWRWCDATPWGVRPTEFSWWQRSGMLLSITIEDRGFGRVDIGIGLHDNQDIRSCEGAARSIQDLRINSTEFRWRDSGLDWLWRPVGTYTNNSDSTIVYAQVTYEITGANGYTARFVDDPMDDLAPGKSARIMPENWFRLEVSDFSKSQIGMELSYGSGATFIGYVNYIRYEDGTSVGNEKFIN